MNIIKPILKTSAKDLSGQTFGRLTVKQLSTRRSGSGSLRWICECICGNQKEATSGNLKSGDVTSCGCYRRERLTTHGQRDHPLYPRWLEMRQRCSYAEHAGFKWYGARGIRVCERWQQFDKFLADMESSYLPGTSLERKNNNGNYEPGNVIWGTAEQQANNKRNNTKLSFAGLTCTIAQWARITNLSSRLISQRINLLGWNVERALTLPPRPMRGQ